MFCTYILFMSHIIIIQDHFYFLKASSIKHVLSYPIPSHPITPVCSALLYSTLLLAIATTVTTTMRLSLISLLLATAAIVQQQVSAQDDTVIAQKFDDCDVATYYAGMPADVTAWTSDMVHSLLFDTHRLQTNFTNNIDPGIEDVWGALMDVDAGIEPGTIHLVYSDKEIPKEPFGERGWVRDHLFPLYRGVGIAGIDVTDIHNIRAATPLSNIVSADKYFGECQILTPFPEECVAPAEGASEDSCSCERIFSPPASMKGDIARALMYMDLRYDGTELFTRDLRLTDCPFQPERDMAYLSQMLTWHMEDPPDEREITRNNKVCANWQGNRNPFVDFPDLANTLFPPPSPLPGVGERLIYEKCEALPTLAPTFSANDCDLYNEGDFVVWLMNSQKPLSLGLYSFAPMNEGFELYITDNPWNGTDFVEQGVDYEGTIKFVTPSGFERGGKLFGIGLDSDQSYEGRFETVEGTISVNRTTGEPLFLYCISNSGEQRPLTVFNNGGTLADAGLETYMESESALPEDFPEEGIINIPHYDNLFYNGPGPNSTEGEGLEEDDLKSLVRDPANWEGSNDIRYGLGMSSSSYGISTTTSLLLSVVVGAFVLAATTTTTTIL